MDKKEKTEEKISTDIDTGKKEERMEEISNSKLMEPPLGYKSEGPGS